jgi:phage terminase large subunit
MATAGWVLRLIDDAKQEYPDIEEVEIRIDDDGVGGGVTDRLNEVNRERGFNYIIIPVHNGSKSNDEYYGNHGSEL